MINETPQFLKQKMLNQDENLSTKPQKRKVHLTQSMKTLADCVKQNKPEKSKFPHTEGFINGWILLPSKVSKFSIQIFFINGIMGSFFLLIMLTFHQRQTDFYYRLVSSIATASHLVRLVDSYYLYYYKRYSKWIFAFNLLEITFWLLIFLNFSEIWSVSRSINHLIFFSNPCIYITCSIVSGFKSKEGLPNQLLYFSNYLRVVWSVYRAVLLIKLLGIGLEWLKLWMIFTPLIILCGIALISSFFSLVECMKEISQNSFEESWMKAKGHIVLLPLCCYYLYVFLKLDYFFEKEEDDNLILANFWLSLIMLPGFFYRILING